VCRPCDGPGKVAVCHPGSSACHSERSEESPQFAQDKLREGSLRLTKHGQLAFIPVKKWHRDNPYHQRAAGEPGRAKSLCRITESTFPTSRNRRTPNSNAPAASAGPARVRQSNSSPSAFRRAYLRISAAAPPSGRCPIKPSFTKCWKKRQRGQLNGRIARSPAMGGV